MLEKDFLAQVINNNIRQKETIRKRVLNTVEIQETKGFSIMKKKTVLISIVLMCLIGLTTYYSTRTSIYVSNADRGILAKDFNQLVSVSDLIIKTTVLPNKETLLDTSEDGTVKFGYTVSNLKVDEVFYGEISKGDIVTITEEYFKIRTKIFTQGNYIPAKENKEYIFFLKKYQDSTRYEGMYYPIDLERGKYSLNSNILSNIESIEELTNTQLEIGTRPDEDYKEWYKKVIQKYLNK